MHTQISHIRTNITFYDAMGNPTSYLGKTMEWEGKQLSEVTAGNNAISHAYDENGLRTQKTVNGTTTNYHYNGSVLIGMTQGTGANQTKLFFSYDSSGNIVSVSWDAPTWYLTSGTLYYTRNAQGDIVGLLDEQGNKVIDYMYDSWGKDISPLPRDQAYIDLQHFQPFRYRGYVYDSETGWYYLQSRYYNPETHRFISADVLLSTGQGVLGHNSYAYCGNNPINREDAQGHFWNIIVGTVVGAIVGGISAAINGDNAWAGVGIGAAVGFVAGATLGIGLAVAAPATAGTIAFGAAIATVGGAVASGAGELARQAANNETINIKQIHKEAALGGLSNLMSFGIGKCLGLAEPFYKNSKIDILRTMKEGLKNLTPTDRFLSFHFTALVVAPMQLTLSMVTSEVIN